MTTRPTWLSMSLEGGNRKEQLEFTKFEKWYEAYLTSEITEFHKGILDKPGTPSIK